MATKALALPHKAHHMPAWEEWLVRHKRVFEALGALLVVASVVSVLWQLGYPADKALPGARLGGLDVGGKDRSAIAAQLADYAQKGEVTIKSPSKQWKAKWESIGLSVDADASAQMALGYEQWERYIPFSAFIRMGQDSQLPLVALVDKDRLDEFAKKVVAEDKQAAVDATIKVTDGKVLIDDAKNGYLYKLEDVKQQVAASSVSVNATLSLVPERVGFVRSAQELTGLKQSAEKVLGHSLTLKVGDKSFTPSSTTVGSWITFPEDPKTHALHMVLDREAIRKYLQEIDEKTKIAPGTSTVTLIDGQEISRTPAASGKTVAADNSLALIENALTGQGMSPVVPLAQTSVPPKLTYVQSYSQTNAGLLAIIKDWDAANYGDYAVIIRELGGQNRYAEYNPDKSYVTASTFKLFTYYAVQQRIKQGTITYDTMTDMGWRVEDCLTEMIVRSTNPCAISLMNLVGWQAAQDMVVAAGFSGTNINNLSGGDKHSTIRDETNYMMRLYYGTLMEKEPSERLLGYLKRQVWRGGLPSGVPKGVTVADKVGLYDGWVHDVGIIYGPKSTFIVGIMSKGGSDPAFADLARRMYAFFQN